MRFCVVAHPARQAAAEHLAGTLGAHIVMDTTGIGAAGNHRQALQWAAQQNDRVWVLEDDAQPVPRFTEHAQHWADRFPDDLISGYLGTSHPRQWMRHVDRQWNNPADHVRLPQLIHAVCYSIPSTHLPAVMQDIDRARSADFGIGEAWHRTTGRDVVYPKASLVDHADTPSINTTRARRPRKARQLAT